MSYTPTIHIPTQLQAHTQSELSCAQEVRLEQVSQCLETLHTIINASNTPSTEAGMFNHNSGLWSLSTPLMGGQLPHCPL